MLKLNGYITQLVKYDATDFGIPQMRKRVILYAAKTQKFSKLSLIAPSKKTVLLKDILTNLHEVENHNIIPISDRKDLIIAKHIKQGQKLCNVRGGDRSVHTWEIPEVFGKTSKEEVEFLKSVMKLRRQIRRRNEGDADPVERKYLRQYFNGSTDELIKSLTRKGYIKLLDKKYIELTNTFNGKFKRLDINGISPTVDTRFGNYKNFIHPIENRALSVREAARIQGFADNFIFYGPTQKQYEMVGNAVPPPLAKFIAKNIKKILSEMAI